MGTVVALPVKACARCGRIARHKIMLVDVDSGLPRGVKHVCSDYPQCEPVPAPG